MPSVLVSPEMSVAPPAMLSDTATEVERRTVTARAVGDLEAVGERLADGGGRRTGLGDVQRRPDDVGAVAVDCRPGSAGRYAFVPETVTVLTSGSASEPVMM